MYSTSEEKLNILILTKQIKNNDPNLTELDSEKLDYMQRKIGLEIICEMLKVNTSITRIEIENYHDYTPYLGKILSSNETIEDLCLRGDEDIFEAKEDWNEFVKAIKENASLKSLEVSMSLTDEQALTLVEAIQLHPTLKSLNIS